MGVGSGMCGLGNIGPASHLTVIWLQIVEDINYKYRGTLSLLCVSCFLYELTSVPYWRF